jgi:hypothetical protein
MKILIVVHLGEDFKGLFLDSSRPLRRKTQSCLEKVPEGGMLYFINFQPLEGWKLWETTWCSCFRSLNTTG